MTLSEKATERMKYPNKHQSITTRRQTVFGYLAEPEETRLDLKKFLKTHKIQKRTFYLLEGEYRATKLNLTKQEKEEHKEQLKATVMDAWDRVEGKEPPKRIKGIVLADISNDEKLALARKVYQDAMTHGASARDKDLAVRMLGMLIEKSEVKIGLTADERARREAEANRELAEWHRGMEGQGISEVQERLALLPNNIRQD